MLVERLISKLAARIAMLTPCPPWIKLQPLDMHLKHTSAPLCSITSSVKRCTFCCTACACRAQNVTSKRLSRSRRRASDISCNCIGRTQRLSTISKRCNTELTITRLEHALAKAALCSCSPSATLPCCYVSRCCVLRKPKRHVRYLPRRYACRESLVTVRAHSTYHALCRVWPGRR